MTRFIRKTYIMKIVGDGVTYIPLPGGERKLDVRRPKLADIAETQQMKASWFMHELGDSGFCLCTVTADEETHERIALEAEYRAIAVNKNLDLTEEEIAELEEQYPELIGKFDTSRQCDVKSWRESTKTYFMDVCVQQRDLVKSYTIDVILTTE